MKHTPGPWKIDEASDLPLAVIRDDENGEDICEIGARTPENYANAKLIAVAPRLLKAAETYLNVMSDIKSSMAKGYITPAREELLAAIREGKS